MSEVVTANSTNEAFRSVDPLGEALHALRFSGAFFCRSELTAPWGIDLPPMSDSLIFHIITEGAAWVRFANGERFAMEAGDFALLPQGRGHAILDAPETPAINLYDYERPLLSPRYELLKIDGGGAPAGLICGVVSVKDPAARRMVSLLPKIILMQASTPGNEWLRASVQLMLQEAISLGPGGDAVLTRTSDIFVLQAIRHWLQTDPHAQTGWLGALQDRQIGRVLSLIHQEPTRHWTVESLAETVGVSRSGLAARFVDLVGQTPMAYLRQWRFEVAHGWLVDTDKTLAGIAEELGYESEASFSRAYKKATGQTPGSVRRGSE
ncbi:AraC family transcriptional regulator [Rubellicoccus peritrichatus]|uniref:AraC family transcriptional regulator n=1 Tax=Rubellicoccus peritrichatus TaxID=3080537 RepID=A0AAQ3QSK8_9BACT|nr:AraC family transcriptional regulator [Puniceicoccus sp. CR14]WOO42593.1 AraC family transcriptional regulator [Puniceicoccus sp. CR14]